MAARIIELVRATFLVIMLGWLCSCANLTERYVDKESAEDPSTKKMAPSVPARQKSTKASFSTWRFQNRESIVFKSFFDPNSSSGATRQMKPVTKELLFKAIDAIKSKDWDIAQGSLERAIKLHPADEYLWTQLAFICVQRGDVAQGITLAKKAMAITASNPALHAEIESFIDNLRSTDPVAP